MNITFHSSFSLFFSLFFQWMKYKNCLDRWFRVTQQVFFLDVDPRAIKKTIQVSFFSKSVKILCGIFSIWTAGAGRYLYNNRSADETWSGLYCSLESLTSGVLLHDFIRWFCLSTYRKDVIIRQVNTKALLLSLYSRGRLWYRKTIRARSSIYEVSLPSLRGRPAIYIYLLNDASISHLENSFFFHSFIHVFNSLMTCLLMDISSG